MKSVRTTERELVTVLEALSFYMTVTNMTADELHNHTSAYSTIRQALRDCRAAGESTIHCRRDTAPCPVALTATPETPGR